MDKKLAIKPGRVLLQIDGTAYKIPKYVNLVRKFKRNQQVMDRTFQLSHGYGNNFCSFDLGISCVECDHLQQNLLMGYSYF